MFSSFVLFYFIVPLFTGQVSAFLIYCLCAFEACLKSTSDNRTTGFDSSSVIVCTQKALEVVSGTVRESDGNWHSDGKDHAVRITHLSSFHTTETVGNMG